MTQMNPCRKTGTMRGLSKGSRSFSIPDGIVIHRCFGACLEKPGNKYGEIDCYYTKKPYVVKKISGFEKQQEGVLVLA